MVHHFQIAILVTDNRVFEELCLCIRKLIATGITQRKLVVDNRSILWYIVPGRDCGRLDGLPYLFYWPYIIEDFSTICGIGDV